MSPLLFTQPPHNLLTQLSSRRQQTTPYIYRQENIQLQLYIKALRATKEDRAKLSVDSQVASKNLFLWSKDDTSLDIVDIFDRAAFLQFKTSELEQAAANKIEESRLLLKDVVRPLSLCSPYSPLCIRAYVISTICSETLRMIYQLVARIEPQSQLDYKLSSRKTVERTPQTSTRFRTISVSSTTRFTPLNNPSPLSSARNCTNLSLSNSRLNVNWARSLRL